LSNPIFNKEQLLKTLEPVLAQAREASIGGKEGRPYLVASADAYGYEVDGENNILLKDGSVMTSKHPDYSAIIRAAKKDARNGPLWRDL